MSEANKKAVQRFFEEVWGKGDLSLLSELVRPDYVGHMAPHAEPIKGIESLKQFIAMYHGVFADTSFTVEDQLAEGGKVAARWTASAGEMAMPMGDAGGSGPVSVTGISILRFTEGKIAESWATWDTLSLLQSGVGPDVFESLSLSV